MGMSLALTLFSSFRRKKRSPKRLRRKRKRDNLVSLDIPLDLQIDILTRLPAESLMRFKCVSKLWFSLIRSRYFTNLYLMVAPPPRSPRLYISLMNPDSLISLSLSSSNSVESFDHDLTMRGLGGHDMSVLRGLILYTIAIELEACIYNPTTRQNVNLPRVKSNIVAQEGCEEFVYYFFGHDPILDQHKVVCTIAILSEDLKIIASEHWVFVLEVGGSWKIIECNQDHDPLGLGLCINGVIYYLAETDLAETDMSGEIVVSFDVSSEEFTTIQAPYYLLLSEEIIDYGGNLAIFDFSPLQEEGLVNLWVLEDGGKWSTKSLVLQPYQMHLVNNIVGELSVAGTTKNGEVILAPDRLIFPYYILFYDIQRNDLRKIDTRGIPDQGSLENVYLTLMDKSESIMHLET